MQLRSQIIMKTNWLRMKKQFLAYMSKEKLSQLEYRDDQKYNSLQPTAKEIKQVPYMQNNPANKNVISATSEATGNDMDQRRRIK